MRRKLVHMVVAAAVALVPVWAMAGNQEFAEEIAATLRDSGKLQDYKVGVKFQDGTAWLRGHVANQEQMNTALNEVLAIPGVDRAVNNLEIAGATLPQQASGPVDPANILRSSTTDLSAQQGLAASQTVARLEAASPNALRSQSHPVDVVPSLPAVDRLASSFTAEGVLPTTVTSSEVAAPSTKKLMPVNPERRGRQLASKAPTKAPARPSQPLAVAMASAPAAAPAMGAPLPQYVTPVAGGTPQAQYDQPNLPNYSWPSYAAHPNYAAVTYPKQYSPTAWPYIGPFYPYPQVPLGWRKVTLEWHDGWWQLDFDDGPRNQWFSGLFRAPR